MVVDWLNGAEWREEPNLCTDLSELCRQGGVMSRSAAGVYLPEQETTPPHTQTAVTGRLKSDRNLIPKNKFSVVLSFSSEASLPDAKGYLAHLVGTRKAVNKHHYLRTWAWEQPGKTAWIKLTVRNTLLPPNILLDFYLILTALFLDSAHLSYWTMTSVLVGWYHSPSRALEAVTIRRKRKSLLRWMKKIKIKANSTRY